MCSRIFLIGVIAGLVAVFTVSAGRAWPAEQRQQDKQRNNQRNPNTAVPPVDHSASAKARKDMIDAQAALNNAQSRFDDVARELRSEFQQSGEYRTALAAVEQAQADFDAARAIVLGRLADDPAYKAARQKKEAAEKARDELDAAPGSPEQTAAATAVLDAASEVSKLETAAINADPAASAARERLAAASARLNDLKKKFEDSIANHPKLQALRKELETAKAKLSAAEKALDAALQNEAQQEMQRQQRIAEIERQRDRDRDRNIRRTHHRNRR